jgi:hypothetical protein
MADLIWQASVTIISNHILKERGMGVQGTEGASHIDLMIFSVLVKINVTAIILIKKVSMFIHFCIAKHQQTLMPFFQLLLNTNKTMSLQHKQNSNQVKRKR